MRKGLPQSAIFGVLKCMYPGGKSGQENAENSPFSPFFRSGRLLLTRVSVRCKYLSKWCGNPLALTIYVNANELRFLSH